MRGISPVVATILMVVIAITAAVVAYSWFTSVQGSLQAKASQRLSTVSSVTFTVPVAKCGYEINADTTDYHTVTFVITNLSDEDIINEAASAALLDAQGKVLDMNDDLTITVKAQGTAEFNVYFNTECNASNVKALMVTIGSASVAKAFK